MSVLSNFRANNKHPCEPFGKYKPNNERQNGYPVCFRVTSFVLGQSCDCSGTNESTLKNVGLNPHNIAQHSTTWHNKTKYDKTVCVFYGVRPTLHIALQWRQNGRDSVSNHQPHDCLLNRLFRRRSKKTSKLRVTGLCEGNSLVTGEFPAQMASNAENVSIWWRHHAFCNPFLGFHCNQPLSSNTPNHSLNCIYKRWFYVFFLIGFWIAV